MKRQWHWAVLDRHYVIIFHNPKKPKTDGTIWNNGGQKEFACEDGFYAITGIELPEETPVKITIDIRLFKPKKSLGGQR